MILLQLGSTLNMTAWQINFFHKRLSHFQTNLTINQLFFFLNAVDLILFIPFLLTGPIKLLQPGIPINMAAWQTVHRAPGEIKRSRDLRGGRWSWTLTFAQKRSWVGRWSWAEQVGRLLLRVVQVVHQQRCNGHCLSDSVQHSSWKSNCAVHKSLGNGEGTPP